MEFGLRPNAEGAGAHASVRGEREREFGGIIAVGSIEDDQEIAVARGKIDVLDLHPDLLGQLLGGFGALQVWSWLQANLLFVISPRPTLSALRTILRFGHSHSVAPKLKE